MKDIQDAIERSKLAFKEEVAARLAVSEAEENLANAKALLSAAIVRSNDARRGLDGAINRALVTE
jgi:hypothetical protein